MNNEQGLALTRYVHSEMKESKTMREYVINSAMLAYVILADLAVDVASRCSGDRVSLLSVISGGSRWKYLIYMT